jgi:hypothetical protein
MTSETRPPHSRYPKEEIARRGDEMYERDISPHLKKEDEGKFILIDIMSGDYEVDDDEIAASDRLRARRPQAQPWLRRVGSRYAYRLGRSVRTGMVPPG